MSKEHTNALINESSPYLLQHAHNPVNWYPWGKEALALAKEQNKPLLISVGYAACHWCHVMEHESFENDSIAALMNENFVCIKVDREERPDIDQVYMDAVQLMTGRGGWPMNCFALPDGRPFYGGTYFPPQQWTEVLQKLSDAYQNEYDKVEEYANKLTDGVKQSGLVDLSKSAEKSSYNSLLQEGVATWQKMFDLEDGGTKRPPKFPLPNNYKFLLHYANSAGDTVLENYVSFTLKKMATGGIFDQIGGGFARYSVDGYWKVPHFEKMLYDNGQLIELYALAYKKFQEPWLKRTVEKTIGFLQRELYNKELGAFYSSLDADSEGEEGKYYVWKSSEVESLLSKEDYEIAKEFFELDKKALWEHGNNILLSQFTAEEFANEHNKNLEAFIQKLAAIEQQLLSERQKRIAPGLDDKILCGWNAMTVSGLFEAYQAFGNESYKKQAEKTLAFILTKMRREDGGLWRNYKGKKASINAYLEDYAFTIQSCIKAYESTFNPYYLDEASDLVSYVMEHFFDDRSGFFFFTSAKDEALISRKIETNDNVIPASNSVMAENLFKLGEIQYNQAYLKISERMLATLADDFVSYASGYSNWGILMLHTSQAFKEIAIVGKNAQSYRQQMQSQYLPNALYLGSEKASLLPLLKQKYVEDKTLIYVCVDKACNRPLETVEEFLAND